MSSIEFASRQGANYLPDDIVVVGGPSAFAEWGFDLVRQAVRAHSPSIEIHAIAADQLLQPASSRPRRAYFSSFPIAELIEGINANAYSVTAFFDEPLDSIAYLMRTAGCTLQESLRLQTGAATANAAIRKHTNSLVIRRSTNARPADIVMTIIRHLRLDLKPAEISALLDKFASKSTLEENLAAIPGYSALEETTDKIPLQTASIYQQVLGPLFAIADKKAIGPFVWPTGIFLHGDRPNEPAPLIADVTGGARIIYYGPYIHLPPGPYNAQFLLAFSNDIEPVLLSLEIYSASTPLTKVYMTPRGGGIFKGEFSMVHTHSTDKLEVRLWTHEGALTGQVGLARIEFFLQE